MKRNAAEQVFINVLSEVPSVEKNGITHSDEYFEIMLDDANLSNEERAESLIKAQQAALEKVSQLENRRDEIAEKLHRFDGDEGAVALRKAIAKEQRYYFGQRVFWLSTTFFAVVILVITNLFVFDAFSAIGLGIAAAISYVLALILARAASNKPMIYAQAEKDFLEELEEKRLKLTDIQEDILSLERLKTFIDRMLKLDNLEGVVRDLKGLNDKKTQDELGTGE